MCVFIDNIISDISKFKYIFLGLDDEFEGKYKKMVFSFLGVDNSKNENKKDVNEMEVVF